MKRDPDLMREILLEIENPHRGMKLEREWDTTVLSEHRRLCVEGGYIEPTIAGPSRLTSKGHDVVEAIRDIGTWNTAKGLIADKFGPADFLFIPGVCYKLSRENIEAGL